jgi:hypothetical protein
MRTLGSEVIRGRWGRSLFGGSLSESVSVSLAIPLADAFAGLLLSAVILS